MNRDEMSDRDLLSAFADNRDVVSLGVFLTRHQDPLLRFASGVLGDLEAAQDVVQETFLQVIRRPRRLLEVDSCRNYLLRVTRNIGVDHLRRLARDRRFASRAARLSEHDPSGDGHGLIPAEERARVREAILALAPHHREVLLLKIEHEKSYREIAEITGLTVPNVGYRLHEAMKALARRLHNEDPVK